AAYGHARRGAPLERGRARTVASNVRDRRPCGEARHWKRTGRLSRSTRVHRGEDEDMTVRLDRLRASLEEPLLVTNPVNVRYLVGFKSSNAALLVDNGRTSLFTDFRYVTAAREVDGVDFVEPKRDLIGDLASRLSGRIGFESTFLSYAAYERLRAGGLDLVPRPGAVESLRAIKDEEELGAIRRACAITDRVYERLAAETFVGPP